MKVFFSGMLVLLWLVNSTVQVLVNEKKSMKGLDCMTEQKIVVAHRRVRDWTGMDDFHFWVALEFIYEFEGNSE